MADWCRVDLLKEDGTPYPLIITHVDPEKVAWAYQLSEMTPYDPDAPTGTAAVLRNKISEFLPHIPDEFLVAAAKDEQELALIRSIGLSSSITVPLVVQDKGVGRYYAGNNRDETALHANRSGYGRGISQPRLPCHGERSHLPASARVQCEPGGDGARAHRGPDKNH